MYEYNALIDYVVDGDTLDAIVDIGFKISTKQRLRLCRVDTPERNDQGYFAASEFVKAVCLGKKVKIRTTKASKFGYYLAEIILEDGTNLSDLLISSGLGVSYEGGKK
jgi:micrococcal nuclease